MNKMFPRKKDNKEKRGNDMLYCVEVDIKQICTTMIWWLKCLICRQKSIVCCVPVLQELNCLSIRYRKTYESMTTPNLEAFSGEVLVKNNTKYVFTSLTTDKKVPYTLHSCIRRTPEIGQKYWQKALLACIRHTPKVGKNALRKLK